MSSSPYYLMITFWGKLFTEHFYSFCLSSLLSPNNLPILRGVPGSKFLISTTRDDWNALEGRPLFEQMRQYVEPVLIDIGYPDENKALSAEITGRHRVMLHMSTGHRLAARKALADRAWAGFVAPDLLVSDGTIAFIIDKARQGKKAVLAPVFRYATEPVVESLEAQGFLRPDDPMDLKPRFLAELARRSLHSEIRSYEFDAPYFGDYPLWCYWPVPERKAIVIHSMSWGLLFGDFAKVPNYNDDVLDNDTTDGKYIYNTFYQGSLKEDLYYSTDSDEVFYLSLTPESELTYLPFQDRPINSSFRGKENRIYEINRYLFSQGCDEFRRLAYRLPCHIHGDGLAPESIEMAKTSSAIVERAIAMGNIERFGQRVYLDIFQRHKDYWNNYPSSVAGLFFMVIKSKIQRFPRIIIAALLRARSRILRAVFGWWVGPVLGSLGRQWLVLILKFVPKRYVRPILKRIRLFQARAGSAEGNNRYVGGSSNEREGKISIVVREK